MTLISLIPIALFASYASAYTPPEWEKSGYALEVTDRSVKDVLEEFANTFAVTLVIERGLDLNKTINTKVRSQNAAAFLDRLGIQYRFDWFVYGNALYISDSTQRVTERIKVGKRNIDDLREALVSIRLFEDKFGWGVLEQEGAVIVNAPERYISLIERVTEGLNKENEIKSEKEKNKYELMVFRLKHADVGDRSVSYRGQNRTIPGVATIFNNLIGTGSSPKPGSSQQSIDESADSPYRTSNQPSESLQSLAESEGEGSILDRQRRNSTESVADAVADQRAIDLSEMRVQADIRNNALLVYAPKSKRTEFENIITAIDIPAELIEINAIIIDVERSSLLEAGLEWGVTRDDTEFGFNASQFNPFIPANSAASFFIQNADKFFANLRFLETQGDASIVANPSVLTQNNLPAVIDLNQTEFLTASAERAVQVLPVTAGTSLRVTPHLIETKSGDLVQLDVTIEDGTVARGENEAANVSSKTNTLNTQAMVRDKNTMIFGGFNVKRLSNSERKIPLLGDIPWLGALFTYNSAGGSNRERLFLLTPRKVEIDKSPLDYATDLNSRYINKALDTVAQKFPTERLEPTSEELLDDVQRAVKTLTLEAVPAGFRRVPLSKYSRQNPTYRNKKWCSGLGSFIDYDSASVYVGEDFNVLVAHTVNFKTTDVIYDRSFCRKKAVIGSGLWPRNKLAPGESGEIFIVIKKTTGKTKR